MAYSGVWSAGGKLMGRVKAYGELVMFSHTVFSLSFAALSMILAANGLPPPHKIVWILLAFLGARTGANALNRVIDAGIDARNPRTASRQIPKGKLGRGEAVVFATVCFAVMALSAAMLNPLCAALSPIALGLMVFYSYTKRFTWLCHIVLGVTTACAPVGAWLAVTGSFSLTPLVIGAANTLWVAGFDIVYGAQDAAFDKANGLHSIPERFGVDYGLAAATAFHGVAAVCLIAVGLLSPQLGIIYQTGMIMVAALLIAEHSMVSPGNLRHVKFASYGINQIVSVVLLVAGVLDALT